MHVSVLFMSISVRVYINEMPTDDEYQHTDYGDVSSKPRWLWWRGPRTFRLLRLIELGLCPRFGAVVGMCMSAKDLSLITKTQKVGWWKQLLFWWRWCRRLFRRENYTPEARSGKHRENIECVLLYMVPPRPYFCRCSSPYRYGQIAQVIENMRNTILASGRSAFPDQNGFFHTRWRQDGGRKGRWFGVGREETFHGPGDSGYRA